jgi:hypothetical protein
MNLEKTKWPIKNKKKTQLVILRKKIMHINLIYVFYVHLCFVGCGSGYFYCMADNLCIPDQYVCDTRWNCMDGEDEKNCGMKNMGKFLKFCFCFVFFLLPFL